MKKNNIIWGLVLIIIGLIIGLNRLDIISVDLVAYKDGFNGDCCRTYYVGKVSKEAQRLVEVTKQSFFEGIKFAKKGYRLGDICHAIGEYVEKNGYSVVREFQGHGIGESMHEDPGIPNYGKAGRGIVRPYAEESDREKIWTGTDQTSSGGGGD